MPRFARNIPPGSLVHVICRFINREFLITSELERGRYLEFLQRALSKSDWRLVSYAIMSSHAHWGNVAGHQPFYELSKSVNSSFARWYNKRHGRLGPVFADRPTTLRVRPGDALYLIAYQHNNPVRAKVVTAASDSTWTSHRAYVGLGERPSWLDVELGLTLCGFDADSAKEFDQYVRHNALETDPVISGHDMLADRRELRHSLNRAVEVGTPTVDLRTPKLSYPVVGAAGRCLEPRWHGPLEPVLEAVSAHTGIPIEVIRSRARDRTITGARRLMVVLACQLLGRQASEVARFLNISLEGARYHLRQADSEMLQTARALVPAQ